MSRKSDYRKPSVLQNSGILFLSTPNRYSLTVEPHTYLWGVGFLPRSWMQDTSIFKGMDYKHIRLLSYFELKKLLTPSLARLNFHFHTSTIP